jgi:hypothetical protein
MLREGNWEAHAVCSRPWLKQLVLGVVLAGGSCRLKRGPGTCIFETIPN